MNAETIGTIDNAMQKNILSTKVSGNKLAIVFLVCFSALFSVASFPCLCLSTCL